MIYLSGCITPERDPRVGYMVTYKMANAIPEGAVWAGDNGCYPAGEFDWGAYERWLGRVPLERCLFLVVPDKPFDAEGTIQRFEQWHKHVSSVGRPVAFVTQDGMGTEDVPWGDIDAVFVGGSTEWKTGHESGALISEAQRRGKWCHMGRVNSLRRLQAAYSMGCDSVDGTFLKYGPRTNWPRLMAWLDQHEQGRPMRLRHSWSKE